MEKYMPFPIKFVADVVKQEWRGDLTIQPYMSLVEIVCGISDYSIELRNYARKKGRTNTYKSKPFLVRIVSHQSI